MGVESWIKHLLALKASAVYMPSLFPNLYSMDKAVASNRAVIMIKIYNPL